MFWSLILEPGKKYSSTINDGFHLSMAALDVNTAKTPNEIYPVLLRINGKDTVLCNLSKPQFLQVNLDHMFQKGSKVTFYTTGKATIHLTGYLVQDDFDSSEFSDDDSSEVSDASLENVSDLFDKKGKGDSKADFSKKNKRKLTDAVGEETAKKKSKPKGNEADEKGVDMSMNTLNHKSLDSSGDEDDDDDDDDDDIDLSSDDLDSDNLMGGGADSDDSDDEDEDDDGDDDDDDSDDSDEDESDDNEKNQAKMQKAQKTPQQTPKKKPEEKTPNQGKNAQKQQTPTSNKKQNKQNQSLVNGAGTPKSDKKNNKGTPQQNNKGTPQQNNKGTPQPQQKQGGSPQKRTLAGGVHVEDIRVADGPVAKPGKTVAVLYTGRLKSNNRVFDQTMKGSGFKFRLGKGEVIKGWDVGVAGMTVGSKRRITCPPAMAYGKEGSMPAIPPNATLVFDVELKNVE